MIRFQPSTLHRRLRFGVFRLAIGQFSLTSSGILVVLLGIQYLLAVPDENMLFIKSQIDLNKTSILMRMYIGRKNIIETAEYVKRHIKMTDAFISVF